MLLASAANTNNGGGMTVRRADDAVRLIAAALAAFVALGASNGGLFYFARPLQVGLFVGIIVGLVAHKATVAAVLAASVGVAGLVLLPAPPLPFENRGFIDLAILPVTAGVVAGALKALVARRRWFARAAVGLGLAMVVANLWATTIAWDRVSLDPAGVENPFPSLVDQLRGADVGVRDDAFSYISTHQRMRAGMSFYDAFLASHREWDPGKNPSEVWGFRQPHLYWFWLAMPGNGWGIIIGLLIASTGALAATYYFGSNMVRAPLVLPAVAAVAAQMLHATTDRAVVMAESWAVCFILMAIGAYTASQRTTGAAAHAWSIAYIWLALNASLTRVLAAPLLLAGVLASLYAKRGILYVAPRILGLGVFAVAYGAHALAVADLLTHSQTTLVPGGVHNLVAGLRFGTRFFGGADWFPLTLSLMGLVALALIPNKELRLFVGLPTVVLVLSWLVYSNDPQSVLSPDLTVNYWGKLVVPALYACLPALFLTMPGMGRGGPAQKIG